LGSEHLAAMFIFDPGGAQSSKQNSGLGGVMAQVSQRSAAVLQYAVYGKVNDE